jgi:peptidoglycan/xylan/chitin deacetylase (PgdA/CDA1 family)
MNPRLRLVFVGLVLGVLVAVVFASQGCGAHHVRRHAHGPFTAAVGSALPSTKRPARHVRRRHAVRPADAQGPFFGARRGRLARVDAPRGGREVALTFDDGPGPQTTQLVRELVQMHVRATFFVVGSMAAIRPDVVRRESNTGMEVANHTWSHAVMSNLTPAMQRTQIDQTNALLEQLTGRRPRFFRPPAWGFVVTTARLVARERMVGVLRTVDTRDWTLPGVRAIVHSALGVRPGGIVAMHDAGGYSRTQTLQAVPAIVRGLRRRHLRLVTVGELWAGR